MSLSELCPLKTCYVPLVVVSEKRDFKYLRSVHLQCCGFFFSLGGVTSPQIGKALYCWELRMLSVGSFEAGKRMLFSSLGWGLTANPVQCWWGLHRYKPCSGQAELDLGESKFPCASMGEILQANVFAGETPWQLHTHCQKPSVIIPHPVAAVLSLLLTAAGAGSLPSHPWPSSAWLWGLPPPVSHFHLWSTVLCLLPSTPSHKAVSLC